MRARWWLVLGIVVGSLAAGGYLLIRGLPSVRPSPDGGDRLFRQVLAHVRSYSVDSLSDEDIFQLAAAGVLDELEDPYATLETSAARRGPRAHPTPLGLHLDSRDGFAVVVAPIPGSPADLGGLRAGDRLLGVDGQPTDGLRLEGVRGLLDGEPGTRATLRVRRQGLRNNFSVEVLRGPLPAVAAVRSQLDPGGIGRLTVGAFPDGVEDSIRAGLDGLRAKGMRALVLDLRSAVGGTLEQGAAIADLFLDSGVLLGAARGRSTGASSRVTDGLASAFAEVPLAVLVDGGTAGAGEVVAGALQDHDRAALLGTRTFGRGVTQSTFALGGGRVLRLTTALWVTPSGREIQRQPSAGVRDTAQADSLSAPMFRTVGGRVVPGGGGIVPDRLVTEERVGDAPLAAARALLLRAGTPREVLARLEREPDPAGLR